MQVRKCDVSVFKRMKRPLTPGTGSVGRRSFGFKVLGCILPRRAHRISSAGARLFRDCQHGGSRTNIQGGRTRRKKQPTPQAKRVTTPIVVANIQSTILRTSVSLTFGLRPRSFSRPPRPLELLRPLPSEPSISSVHCRQTKRPSSLRSVEPLNPTCRCRLEMYRAAKSPVRGSTVSPMMSGHCDREDMIEGRSAPPDPCEDRRRLYRRCWLAVKYLTSQCSCYAKMTKASYSGGDIRCSRQPNGTPEIRLANG